MTKGAGEDEAETITALGVVVKRQINAVTGYKKTDEEYPPPWSDPRYVASGLAYPHERKKI